MSPDYLLIWEHRAEIVSGLYTSLLLIVFSGLSSIVLGIFIAPLLMSKNIVLKTVSSIFVDAMRCIPFLLFVYLIYFGLPTFGIRISNWVSGAIALVLYNTAYMAELFRGAWVELPQSLLDSGKAFGFTGWKFLRHIILIPVFFRALPMVGNQLIQILKDSAFLTVIAVNELTHTLNGIQSTYFIPFAAFITALAIYWLICMAMEFGFSLINLYAQARRA